VNTNQAPYLVTDDPAQALLAIISLCCYHLNFSLDSRSWEAHWHTCNHLFIHLCIAADSGSSSCGQGWRLSTSPDCQASNLFFFFFQAGVQVLACGSRQRRCWKLSFPRL